MIAMTAASEDFTMAYLTYCLRQGEMRPLAGSIAEKAWLEKERIRIEAETVKLKEATSASEMRMDVPKAPWG